MVEPEADRNAPNVATGWRTRRDKPAGTLRLNVGVSAARLVLPAIVPPFLAAYPEIRLEVIVEDATYRIAVFGKHRHSVEQ